MKNFFDKQEEALGMFSPIILVLAFSADLYTPDNQNMNKDSIKTNSNALKKKTVSVISSIAIKNEK